MNSKETYKIEKKKVNLINKKKEEEFPKYSTQILNIISQTMQATRPKVVGQMSEIIPNFIKEFKNKNDKKPNSNDWTKFYLKNYPDEYELGLEKLLEGIKKYQEVFSLIDEDLAKKWYDNFLLKQNFFGFEYEEIIKNDLISKGFEIRKSTPKEESKNIDFFFIRDNEEIAYNIKPESINQKGAIKIQEEIKIIKYKVDSEKKIIYWFE